MEPTAARAWAASRPAAGLGEQPVCHAPSMSLEFDPNGWVYGCCANQLYPLGRIGHDRLVDLWRGPRAQVISSALERWDLSVGCGSCRWHLEHGRMDPDAAVYDTYALRRRAVDRPTAMTFALSNRCNLGCIMCTPELSSTLRRKAGLEPLTSPYDDEFFDDLAGFLPHLHYAKFLGGEPFLIPEHYRVWELMVEVGGPERIQVTTNGTVWNDRVERVLAQFKVDITISIDGCSAETYEAVRSGASFETLTTNIGLFRQACLNSGTELRFCFCLMPQNAHELAGMVRWCDELGAALSVNVVTDLGLAVHDLPLSHLEEIRAGWATAESEAPFGTNAGVWRTQTAQLDSVIHERRSGTPAPARQPVPVTSGWMERLPVDRSIATLSANDLHSPDVARERQSLKAWAQGGPCAEVRGTLDGTITSVTCAHERLGIDSQLIGCVISDLPAAVERSDGRTAWTIDVDDHADDSLVHTMILSAAVPVRGMPGSIVRIVTLTGSDGFVLLVAEDRVYDEHGSVVVELSAPGP